MTYNDLEKFLHTFYAGSVTQNIIDIILAKKSQFPFLHQRRSTVSPVKDDFKHSLWVITFHRPNSRSALVSLYEGKCYLTKKIT